ncbi:hypothetical protein Tco_1305021 [Tanacetum coccineum]
MGCDENRMSIILAAVFVAVSILQALKTEDLSRKLEVNYVKFQFRGGLLGSGYQQKDRKPSQNDKTEHGMEKTVQNQGQSPKMSKSESILKNQQSNQSRN